MSKRAEACDRVRGSGCGFFGDVGAAGDCHSEVGAEDSSPVGAYGVGGNDDSGEAGSAGLSYAEADSGSGPVYVAGGGLLYGCAATPSGTALGLLVVLVALARRRSEW